MAESTPKSRWFTLKERKEILDIFKLNYENGIKTNCADIARRYNVSRSTILGMRNVGRQHWENKIDEAEVSSAFDKRKKSANIYSLEEIVYEWFKQKRCAGLPITCAILKEKALLMKEKMNVDIEFKASNGWLCNFLKRFNNRLMSMQGENSQQILRAL